MNNNEVMAMTNCSMNDNLSFTITVDNAGSGTLTRSDTIYTGWGYWQNYYYPQIIRESYPVYIQEKAKDKGKQAFEIIKILKDKKLVDLKKVGDFIDLMDELIKII